MNRFIPKILSHLSLAAAVIVVCAGLQSCIFDDENCVDSPTGNGDMMTLSFRIVSNGLGNSRALDVNDHGEEESVWPAFEDVIQINDLAFFLFAKDKNDGWPLIMKMTDAANPGEYMSIENNGGAYTVSAKLPRSIFEATIGMPILWGQGQTTTFRVIAIANCGQPSMYNTLEANDFDAILDQARNMMFNMAAVHSTNDGDSGISGIYKGGIPMYGMNTFEVSDDMLVDSSDLIHAWIGNVDMLRALAKIVVVDNIEKMPLPEDADPMQKQLPAITQVSIVSSTDRAYLLPFNAIYYIGKDDLNVAAASAVGTFEYKLGYLNEEDKSSRFGYIPEQSIVVNGTPKALVTVEMYEDYDNLTTTTETYEVPLSGYDGINFSENLGSDIFRNHIYTLRIDGVKLGGKLDLTVNVADWDESPEYNIDFTQTPTIRDLMSWDGNDGEVDAEGNVVIQPWTTTPQPLKGDFYLQGPIGGTWTASLLTLEGAQDAFYFIDSNGNEVGDQFSGDINGKDVQKFSIVSRDPAPASTNRAKLQILVTVGTPPNTMVSEVFLGPKNVTYTNFTIVQNPL